MITIRGPAGLVVRVAFEDVELTVANDTTVLHGSDGPRQPCTGDPSADCGPHLQVLLWAAHAGTAARSEGLASRLPEILQFSQCPNS